MVTIADVERIFRRQGWSYRLEGGVIVSRFDGVSVVIGVESGGARVGVIVFRGRVSPARASDLETFLAALNRAQPNGYLEYDRGRETVYFWTGVSLSGGPQDDQWLAQAIALAILAVKGVGPVVEALVSGRIALSQALAAIDRARGRGAA